MQKASTLPVAAALAAMLAACGGGGKHSGSLTKGGATAVPSPMLTPKSPRLGKPMGTATVKPRNLNAKSNLGKPEAAVGNGAGIFSANCSSCHQANGKGVPGTFPPLAGNPAVNGPAAKVIHIVKDGLTGPVVVAGTTYNGTMPPWKGKLTDAEIAQVVSFIRTAWGNHGTPVTPSQVSSTK